MTRGAYASSAATPAASPPPAPWHTLDAADVVSRLESSVERGLDVSTAARRLAEHGPNELVDRGGRAPLLILWEQVATTLVVMLIVAAVVSWALGDLKDAIAILAIVILNATLGFSQEYRADRAMRALKQLAAPVVRVRRDGVVSQIPAPDLVPGDIVSLDAGSIVPADCRVLESANLKADESALTGESVPVEKHVARLDDADLPVADRINMVYAGTHVTYGRAQVAVTSTGMRTELGRIADMLQVVTTEPTPLQVRLARLGHSLAIIALVIVFVVVVEGLAQGESLRLMFLTGVSLAVAAVPEGLPAVVTIALALGAQRLLRRRALIRKLPAVETLGSVTVICSDKTGTLTENRMRVTALVTLDRDHAIGPTPVADLDDGLRLLLAAAALCTDAELVGGQPSADAEAVGDPTETAMVVAAARAGLRKDALERAMPRVSEIPFDSVRKRMTTVHRVESLPEPIARALDTLSLAVGSQVAFTKGAIDGVLECSSEALYAGSVVPLTDVERARLVAAHDRLAASGVRVLAVACRAMPGAPDRGEADLTFVGLVGMTDPPRPEVAAAVRRCRSAGIRPVMITGDHPLTARAIAAEVGIQADGREVTGRELAAMDDETLAAVVETTSVYARVAPEHKLSIVRALQRGGHVVAMTGDGVNDAPALKRADIGIAMGVTGTDVSTEAADVVLQDDNFATIVAAVEEGRVIYDNIRKFIKYLLTTNSGELWVMLAAPLLGLPLPLLPLQILWINLVTDGLPAIALSVEPGEADAMRRRPTATADGFLDRAMFWHILWVGCLIGLISLGIGYRSHGAGDPAWQTLVFTTVTYAQLAHVMAIRSSQSLFRAGVASNPALLGAVILMALLQLAVIYVPGWRAVFGTVRLSGLQLTVCVLLSALVFVAVETEKWLQRRRAASDLRGRDVGG
jgi:Ca2+-transporting ATPase